MIVAAKTAMITTTISTSIKVNALRFCINVSLEKARQVLKG